MHDPRVGRFFAVDPLSAKYPYYSPYQFSSNSPILSIELEGLETSKLLNESEKKQIEEKHGKLTTWLGLRMLDVSEAFINIGRLTQGKLPQSAPIIQNSETENFGSLKSLATTSIEIYSLYDLSRTGTLENNDEGVGYFGRFFSIESRFSLPSVLNGTNYFDNYLSSLPVFTIDEAPFIFSGYKVWGRLNGEQVASYTYSAQRGLEIELNIPKQYNNLNFGTRFFNEAVKETEAKVFTATWVQKDKMYESGQSVNLAKYRTELSNGKTIEDAAFSTWSGKRAKDCGFKKVTVKEIENGVEATFSR